MPWPLCPRKETQHPFLVIGKYQHPCTLKCILHLPVECRGQIYSCIDRKVFKHWFFCNFIPSVIEHCHKIGMLEDNKNMLLLDNCNANYHKFELWSGNISVLYLPPNVMPFIQPMDQRVIQYMKCYYRQGCLRKLVNHERTVKDFQCTYTIKDAVFNVAYAWNSVKAKTLPHIWRHLWPAIMISEGASDEGGLT